MEQSTALEELRKRLKATIGKRVAGIRNDLNKSQPDVISELEKYGISRTQGSVSQIETGKRLPSLEALYVIAQFLDTSTDYLLGLTFNQLSAVDIEEELATAKGEGKINKLMRGISREKQQQVLQFAEYLLYQEGSNKGDAPTIRHIPLTEDQRLNMAAKRILDLVEKNHGLPARKRIERQIREQFTDDDGAS